MDGSVNLITRRIYRVSFKRGYIRRVQCTVTMVEEVDSTGSRTDSLSCGIAGKKVAYGTSQEGIILMSHTHYTIVEELQFEYIRDGKNYFHL